MTKSARYQASLSGPILGTIINALQIEHGDLKARTARRYFKGQRIKDSEKSSIFEGIGEAVADLGIIPSSSSLEREGIPPSQAISLCIALWSEEWDKIVGQMRAASSLVDRPDLAAMSYLRLVTIDLALRVSAVLWLSELPTPQEGTPLWAMNKGGAQYLKQLLDRCGASRPTRSELAERVGVSRNTVDNWLDKGTRPEIQNLDRVAEVLAPYIDEVSVESLKTSLHRHYILCALGDLLSLQVGREHVVELGTALMRLTSRNLAGLRTFSKLQPREAAMHQFLILIWGVRFIASEHLLRALWRQEEDPIWSADLDAAFGPWHERLSHLAQYLGGLDEVVQKAQDKFGIPRGFSESVMDELLRQAQTDQTRLHIADSSELDSMTFIRVKGDAEYSASNRMIQAAQAQSEGDYETAVVHLRRAVELQPESSWYHFHLGACLGLLGRIEEGIQECFISAQLDDAWELPNVEVGIILLNADRPREAREHLEKLALYNDDPSAHLALNLGVARMRSEDYGPALEMLQHAIRKDPDNGLALDSAAHCAFTTGDAKNGRRLAKRAEQLGFSDTYRDWRAGKYRMKSAR